MEEDRLIRGLRRGEPEALEALIRQYAGYAAAVAGLSRWDEDAQITVTLEELRISPLSLTFRVSYSAEVGIAEVGAGIEVIQKDGTSFVVNGGSGTVGPSFWQGFYAFKAPIPLDQIAYIQFGEHQILLPQ